MIRQGKSEIQDGANLGAGVVHTSMALAGLEAYNAGALPFVGRAGERKMTNKTKPQTHTPGPWTYHTGLSTGIITGPDAKAVVDGGGVTEDRPEWEANARLIAAAPELLEAAKMARTVLGELRGGPHEEPVVLRILCDAIDRAEGWALGPS